MEHEKIVAVRYKNGSVSHVKLEDGREMRLTEAVQMALTGDHFVDYIVGYSREKEAYLRAKPDQDITNNLNQLPEF